MKFSAVFVFGLCFGSLISPAYADLTDLPEFSGMKLPGSTGPVRPGQNGPAVREFLQEAPAIPEPQLFAPIDQRFLTPGPSEVKPGQFFEGRRGGTGGAIPTSTSSGGGLGGGNFDYSYSARKAFPLILPERSQMMRPTPGLNVPQQNGPGGGPPPAAPNLQIFPGGPF
jgi:hypothetical protein